MDHSAAAKIHTVDMLEELLRSRKVVMLSLVDGIYEGNADRKPSAAETLESCIEELTEHPRRKICPRPDCVAQGKPMPLSRFSPDRDSRDGHAGVCKKCESKRVRAFGKKKKARASPASNEPSANPSNVTDPPPAKE